MAYTGIPESIHSFNLYYGGSRLIGITGEVNLPEFAAKTQTIEGAGIQGEFDEPIIGQFSSMEMEIPFRVLDTNALDLLDQEEAVDLMLRGDIQRSRGDNMRINHGRIRIAIRGRVKQFAPGKVKMAEQMDASVTVEIVYIMIELDGVNRVELDKLNCVYKVNGKDLLEQVRRNT